MGIEEPGSCSPVGYFLGHGESPLVIIAGGIGEFEDLEVRDRQTGIGGLECKCRSEKAGDPAIQSTKFKMLIHLPLLRRRFT